MNPSKDTVNIYCDGASRGNPGPSAVGVVFKKGDKTIGEISRFLGVGTNNTAEYLAVLYGLQQAVMDNHRNVKLCLDSELVTKQLNGEYRVKNPDMKRLFDLALHMFKWFDLISVEHIPREKNREADSLANKALNLQSLF